MEVACAEPSREGADEATGLAGAGEGVLWEAGNVHVRWRHTTGEGLTGQDKKLPKLCTQKGDMISCVGKGALQLLDEAPHRGVW